MLIEAMSALSCRAVVARGWHRCYSDSVVSNSIRSCESHEYLALFQETARVKRGMNLPLAQVELSSLLQSCRSKSSENMEGPSPTLQPTSTTAPPGSDRPRLWFLHCSKGKDQLAAIAQRSVLLRGIYCRIACGDNLDDAAKDLFACQWGSNEHLKELTWSFNRRGVNGPCKLPRGSVDAAILPGLGARLGKVDLSGQADVEIELLEDRDITGPLLTLMTGRLQHVWIVEVVGRRRAGFWRQFDLGNRAYTSVSSLQADLTLLLLNLANVTARSSVLDPFCGSCSILLLAAWLGAKKIHGIDVDARALSSQKKVRQRSEAATLKENFEKLGLPMPQLVCADSLDFPRPALLQQETYDAVVTDLPYGRLESLAGRSLEEVLFGTLVLARDVLCFNGRVALLASAKTRDICEQVTNSGLTLVYAAQLCHKRCIVVAENKNAESRVVPQTFA